MIEETALVVSVQGALAQVETQRKTSCGSCSARAGCGSHVFSSLFGNRRSLITVHNAIEAAPGDQVVIGLQEAPFMRAAFAIYAVPLLSLIGVAIAGEQLALQTTLLSRELGGLLGGLLGLAAGLYWLSRFSRKIRANEAYQAVILRKSAAHGVSVNLS
jgi:sigma-E factor negative regulatory protein RseC